MGTETPLKRQLPDDRGRAVDVRRSNRDVLGSASRWQRWTVLGMLFFASMMFWWPALDRALSRSLPHDAAVWTSVVVGFGVFAWGLGAMGMIVWLVLPRRASRRIAAWRTAHRACGACGSPLKDVKPEADGCTVCPACGAAWRIRG